MPNMAPPTGTDDAARAAERLRRFASVSQPPSGPAGDRSRNGTPVPGPADVKVEDRSQDGKAVSAATPGRRRTPPARPRARSRSAESRVSERSRRNRRDRDDQDRLDDREPRDHRRDEPRDSGRSQTPSDRKASIDDTTERKRQEDLLKAREDKIGTDDGETRRSSRGGRSHETEKERDERKARERRERKDETGQKRKRDEYVSAPHSHIGGQLTMQPARRHDDSRDRDRPRERDRRDEKRKHDDRDDRRDREKRDDKDDRDRRFRDPRDSPRDTREPRDTRDTRDSRGPRDVRGQREPPRDDRGPPRHDQRGQNSAPNVERLPHGSRNGPNDGPVDRRPFPEKRVELFPTHPTTPAAAAVRPEDSAQGRTASQQLPHRPAPSPAAAERIIEAPRSTRSADVSCSNCDSDIWLISSPLEE